MCARSVSHQDQTSMKLYNLHLQAHENHDKSASLSLPYNGNSLIGKCPMLATELAIDDVSLSNSFSNAATSISSKCISSKAFPVTKYIQYHQTYTKNERSTPPLLQCDAQSTNHLLFFCQTGVISPPVLLRTNTYYLSSEIITQCYHKLYFHHGKLQIQPSC